VEVTPVRQKKFGKSRGLLVREMGGKHRQRLARGKKKKSRTIISTNMSRIKGGAVSLGKIGESRQANAWRSGVDPPRSVNPAVERNMCNI